MTQELLVFGKLKFISKLHAIRYEATLGKDEEHFIEL